MPAASRLSVTSVSCKSIKNCLYFTRGWIKRRFISYPFKKRVRERMAEGQDNFRGRFLNRILSEGSPVGIDSPLPWHGSCSCVWGCRGWLFPRAEPGTGCSLLYFSCKNLHPSTRLIAKALSSSLWHLCGSGVLLENLIPVPEPKA